MNKTDSGEGLTNKDKYTINDGGRGSLLIPMNLSFFEGEKTEKATPKKKNQAREEGQVAKSQEVSTAFTILLIFFSMRMFGGFMMEKITEVFHYSIALTGTAVEPMTPAKLQSVFLTIILNGALAVLPIFAVAMITGFLSNLFQVGWKITLKPLMPKFNRLNPLSGFKRMFSTETIANLIKSLAKFALISYAIYTMLISQQNKLILFLDLPLMKSMEMVADVIIDLGINVGMLYIAIAVLDLVYTRYKHNKGLKMSKQEIKDEYKQVEGNPQIKGKIRQKMREASMRRMMSEIPNADVVITNPTHFAVALKYDRNGDSAPVCVAKGQDFLAQRIKAKAKEASIEIVEDKPLARMLYATVEVGHEIPPELYPAVAEILAYVYKLKNAA